VKISVTAPPAKFANQQQGIEGEMKDFAREPARQQAVKLNCFEALLRRLCYLLAQKGNPDA
jgi:hypothetical protein